MNLKKILHLCAPSVIFLVLIVLSNLGGNDKFPFLILGFLVLLIIIFIFSALFSFITKQKTIINITIGIGIPLLYAGIVIFLSFQNLIDSRVFLGFA